MINISDFDKIKYTIDLMIQFELSISELYKKCADIFKEDNFWLSLSEAEIMHAKNLTIIKEILMEKMERFEVGRPFNITALNTTIAGIKDLSMRVSQGIINHEKMLILARDYEQSTLESHYSEVVRTNDIEYQTLMKEILTQTYEHKQIIQKAINDHKNKV